MADQMVLLTQQWLNQTYGGKQGFGSVDETGKTGWSTIYALTRALQIELGISNTANNFGPSTKTRFKERWPQGIKQSDADNNVHGIIQGALWCKGYRAEYGGITTEFTDNVANSIVNLKNDMGLGGNSTVTLELMECLLSMKQFKLLTLYGGKESVREAQQKINRRYSEWTGIIPTDGLYGREMNKALIQVLQKLEGYSPSAATGNFGDGTKSKLRSKGIINAVNASSNGEWIWLASVALLCNGYEIQISSNWSAELSTSLSEFQNDHKLPDTGILDATTWMSLLSSAGDPDRKCDACDTRYEITDELAEYLKIDGYSIVGRYLSEPGQENKAEKDYFKALRTGELQRIVSHGLKYFPIFQEQSNKLECFNEEYGKQHSKKARKAAKRLGIPKTVIYFAVDYDATDVEVDSNILPYFKGVYEAMAGYKVGIYASRNVCQRVINAGYASAAFVSDMSTGFSGNLGFGIPKDWVFDQFKEIKGYRGKWDLDKVAYSGKIPACSVVSVIQEDNSDEKAFLDWVKKTENDCLCIFNSSIETWTYCTYALGKFILEELRKPTYWGDNYLGLWKVFTPEVGLLLDEDNARYMCQPIINIQPDIKEEIEGLDIAHMAATTLGLIKWDWEEWFSGVYCIGELGGWPLDLIQIWGAYLNDDENQDLETWLENHLGSKTNGKRFGYQDVLADADAYLLYNLMSYNHLPTGLSDSLTEIYDYSRDERIELFYKKRFNSSKEEVIKAFKEIVDGLDVSIAENIVLTPELLLKAADAERLPTKAEAEILAHVYAKFLSR